MNASMKKERVTEAGEETMVFFNLYTRHAGKPFTADLLCKNMQTIIEIQSLRSAGKNSN